MPYEIRVADEIVELRYHGRGDLREHAAARDEVLEICREGPYDKVLVDGRDATVDMSTRELFDFGKSLEAALALPRLRFAAIVREGDRALDITAAVAQTRSVEVSVFVSEDEARAWLTK